MEKSTDQPPNKANTNNKDAARSNEPRLLLKAEYRGAFKARTGDGIRLAIRNRVPVPIQEALTALVRDGCDDPALLTASIGVAAIQATPDEYAEFVHRMQHATSPQEEERFRSALADVADPALFANTLAMCGDGRIRIQDAPYLLVRAMQNRFCGFAAWIYLTVTWDDVEYVVGGLERANPVTYVAAAGLSPMSPTTAVTPVVDTPDLARMT